MFLSNSETARQLGSRNSSSDLVQNKSEIEIMKILPVFQNQN